MAIKSLALAVGILGATGCGGGSDMISSTPGVTPESHSKYFPIMSGPHAVDCTTCHTAATSFKEFSCFNCHGHEQPPTDLLHTSTASYSYASTACYTCHPTGAKQLFDHAHITMSCATCHDMGQPFAALPLPNFTHPSMNGMDCSACHVSTTSWGTGGGAAPQYIDVGGFSIPQPPASPGTPPEPNIPNLPHPTGSQPCSACHTSSGGGQPAIGYDHASPLINSDCGACHEAGSTHMGTSFNSATSEASGAGDTRPFTLASISACEGCVGGPGTGRAVTYAYHFYPVDCHECHSVPRTGDGTVTTGAAYIGNGTPSGAMCQLTSATCPSTGVVCSATAPCPTGQSCRNGTCQINCPSGQSCRNGTCQVNCPSGQFCVNYACDYPSAWWFSHTERDMANPSTCLMCHTIVPN